MSLILTNRPVREYPRNQPAPRIDPRLQEELTHVGGRIGPEGGDLAGQPVYKLVWGQEDRHFERGKMRLRFIDEQLPMVVQERFFVAPDAFSRLAEWRRKRDEKILSRIWEMDYSAFAEIAPMSSYLKEHEKFLDYIQLPSVTAPRGEVNGDTLALVDAAAPGDWLYIADITEIIEIGRPCWYILRWISGKAHGHQSMWEKMRWSTNAYIPELNQTIPMVDNLGPFPKNGAYVPRFEIADYSDDEHEDGFSTNSRKTLEPTRENTIEPVRQEVFEELNVRFESVEDRKQAYAGRAHIKHVQNLIRESKKITDMFGVPENDPETLETIYNEFQVN